jgi:hypothetical protein
VWESAGRRFSGSLDRVNAAAVLGDDPVATAATAIGLGRAQAMRRRVVLIDLLGEGSELSAMVGDPTAPGITDMLDYGVSMRRAAVPIKDQPNLFVVPTGAESALQPVFIHHARWESIVQDFRDAGALVLIVAPALIPSTDVLLNRLDGVVAVRGAVIPSTKVPTLADVRLSAPYPRAMRRTPAISRARIEVNEPRHARLVLFALGALTLAALSWAVWYLRPWASGLGPARSIDAEPASPDSALSGEPLFAGAPSAAWGISLASVNTRSGAMLGVSQVVDTLPSPTYSPTLPAQGGAWWYRVVVGAFPDSASAESTLVALRARGVIQADLGRAIPTPLALLVADSVSESDAAGRVGDLRTVGVPAYALRVAPGWTRVYVGAFDSGATVQSLVTLLDSLNLRATLVARVGSVF